jgi:UDP-N-acetylmuramoyl-tripeptide--D-alanyl-D-alanine ligase
MHKAVFLDRDGTINVDRDYVYDIKDLEFLPNAVRGLKRLQELGYILIIITNQSGIGRGYYSEENYKILMKEFYRRMREEGIEFAADYYCMHAPEEKCDCRKPNTLLIETAIKEHNIDIKKSYFIGDKTADILAGKRSGVKTILVLTGKAGKDGEYKASPDIVCPDLYAASQRVT